MGETPHFRTSVGGFHKGDVTDYIAKTAEAHQRALQEKDKEIARLKERLSVLEQAAIAEEAAIAAAAEEPKASAPAEEVPAAPAAQDEPLSQLELEAYRRAEAAERLASQRAKRLYEALGDICESTQTQLESADEAARATISAMEQQLRTLQGAYAGLTAALTGARQHLVDMDAMIPDPSEGMEEV